MTAGTATIRDVARLAAVSTAPVSNVLNNSRSVAVATRERVLKAVEALGYSPHPAARSMRAGTSRMLGLIVADIINPFFTELVHSVEHAAHAKGYSVLLCNSDEDLDREQQYLQVLRAQRVDGIILAATGHSSKERAAALSRMRVPVVLVDRGFAEFGLDAAPILGVVSRLAEQKGMDLLIGALPELTRDWNVVVLGGGDPRLEAGLREWDAHPRVAFAQGMNEPLAHRIYAGADAFAMPSRFEPCGLVARAAAR